MIELGLTYCGRPSAIFDLPVEEQEQALAYAYARLAGWTGIGPASMREIHTLLAGGKKTVTEGLPPDVASFFGMDP